MAIKMAVSMDEEAFAGEGFAVEGDFVDNLLGLGDPSYKHAGEERKQRHKHIVADVVKKVENLRRYAVGQRK